MNVSRRAAVALVLTLVAGFGAFAIATRGDEPTQSLTVDGTGHETAGTIEPEPAVTTTASTEPPTTTEPRPALRRAPATATTTSTPVTTTTLPAVTLLAGEQITYFDGEGRLMATSIDGRQTKELFGPGTCNGCSSAPSWSPDGTRVVFGGRLVDLRTGTVTSAGGGWPLGWTAGGRETVWWENRVFSVSAPDGSNRRQITSTNAVTSLFSVSADGEWIVYHGFVEGRDGEVVQIAKTDGSVVNKVVAPAPWGGFYGSMSPDSRRIVFRGARTHESNGTYTYEDEGIYAVDVASGELTRVCACIPQQPKWSPRGDLIADIDGCCAFPRRVQVFKADGPADAPPVRTFADSRVTDIMWSPSGRYLLAREQDGSVRILDVETGAERDLGLRLNGYAASFPPVR